MAGQEIVQAQVQDVSWPTIRGWEVSRDVAEAKVAAALKVKHERLGPAAYLEECKREMGWSKRTAYRKLDPKGGEKHRAQAGHKPEVPVRYDLMEQIVNAGFKAMSRAIHPDTGGDAATQAELSSARTALRQVIRALKEEKQ